MLFDLKAIFIFSVTTATLASPRIDNRATVKDVICDLGENAGYKVLITRAQLNAAMNGYGKHFDDTLEFFPPFRPNGFLAYRVNDPTRRQVWDKVRAVTSKKANGQRGTYAGAMVHIGGVANAFEKCEDAPANGAGIAATSTATPRTSTATTKTSTAVNARPTTTKKP